MKKIFVIAAAVALMQGAVFAQNLKSVAEKEVKVNYVKDFQHQVKDATNIEWFQMDEQTFKVTYLDFEKSRQAMVFTPKGSETHYYIEKKYVPTAITDTMHHMFPKYSFSDCWVRKTRGKITYQALIGKKSGILWWRKTKDPKTLNFEVDGKFINAE